MAYSPVSNKVSVWFGLVDYNGNVVGICPAIQYYLDESPTDTKVLCKANSYKPRKFVGTAQEAFIATKAAVETSEEEQQRLFEHLNRKCNCGSGDIWSECFGFKGDSSYCG